MGTGLEMTYTPRTWATVSALVALTACGSLGGATPGASAVMDRLAKLTGRTPAVVPAPAAPNIANAAPGEILLVTILSRNAVAPLTKIADNGDTVTWISPGQVSLTLRGGILIATRGLNEDLMGADVSGVRAALIAGGGTAARTHSYLNSEDQILLRDVSCTIMPDGPEQIATITGVRDAFKYTEACLGSNLAFTNTYWLDAPSGKIVQSRQVVAATTGFLQINPL